MSNVISIVRPDDSSLIRPRELLAAGSVIALLVAVNMLVGQLHAWTGWSTQCWQFTGFRAAAAGGLIVGLSRFARWRALAVVGVGFGLYLMLAHQSPRFFVSASLAGIVGATLGSILYRRPTLSVCAAAISFNVLLTFGSVWRMIIGEKSLATADDYLLGVGLRVLATLLVLIPLLRFTRR